MVAEHIYHIVHALHLVAHAYEIEEGPYERKPPRYIPVEEREEEYDGHDQDLSFRVRSWGWRVWQIDAGVLHYGSRVMKRRNYQWQGGDRHEWDLLRQRNVERFAKTWEPFLAPYRDTIEREIVHMETMNAKLVAEAGDRMEVPECCLT